MWVHKRSDDGSRLIAGVAELVGNLSDRRRRERAIRIVPNDESAIRMVGALLIEQTDDWQDRVYFDMAEYYEVANPDTGYLDAVKSVETPQSCRPNLLTYVNLLTEITAHSGLDHRLGSCRRQAGTHSSSQHQRRARIHRCDQWPAAEKRRIIELSLRVGRVEGLS